jgi:hypothetical protein
MPLVDYWQKQENKILPLLPGLAVILFFFRSLNYSFLQMDDYSYVVRNLHLSPTWANILYWLKNSCIGLYTPLQMFSYMFDYSIWGTNPAGYHLQNIIWHVATVTVIYYLFKELGLTSRTSCILAILYAIHPQRIESVVWIAERKDVMMGTLYFGCLLYWLKSLKLGNYFSATALILMILTCLTKPLGVTIPAIMFLLLVYRQQAWSLGGVFKKLWPYIIVAVIYVLLKLVYIQHIANDFTAPEKDFIRTILLVSNNVMMYSMKTFFPGELVPIYPFFEPYGFDLMIIALFYVALFVCLLLLFYRCKKFLLYQVFPPIICFIVALLPVIGLFSFSNTDFADRYSYIPSFFILWLLGIISSKFNFSDATANSADSVEMKIFLPKKFLFVLPLAIIFYTISLAMGNIFYMPAWENGYALYQKICDRKNANYGAMIKLAAGELANNNIQDAAKLTANIQAKPWMSAEEKMKITLLKKYFETMLLVANNNDEAITRLLSLYNEDKINLAVVIAGGNDEVVSAIIKFYLKHGDKTSASNFLKKHADSIKAAENALFYRGLAALFIDDLNSAYNYFKKASDLSPGNAQIMANLVAVENKLREQSKLHKIKQ